MLAIYNETHCGLAHIIRRSDSEMKVDSEGSLIEQSMMLEVHEIVSSYQVLSGDLLHIEDTISRCLYD